MGHAQMAFAFQPNRRRFQIVLFLSRISAIPSSKPSASSVFAFVPLGFSEQNVTVSLNGEPTLAYGEMVAGEYFSGLGVTPLLGRTITEEDEQPGASRVAVISYAYWSRPWARPFHRTEPSRTLGHHACETTHDGTK